MRSFRLLLRRAALIAASAVIFAAAAHAIVTSIIDAQRARHVGDIADVVLRRAETMVDFAASTLSEIASGGALTCDPAGLQALRLQVYRRSAIKDIRSVDQDGAVLCSAYSETLEFDEAWAERKDMLTAQNGALRMFRIPQIEGVALGVLRDIDNRSSLVAVLGFNAYLFDILPSALRGQGDVRLELADGQLVGHLLSEDDDLTKPESLTFSKASQRYPFRAEVVIAGRAFAAWDHELYVPSVLGASVLGVIFGLLLCRAFHMAGPLAEMDEGLKRGEFKPFYQPIFDLQTGAICGCEILARWVRSDGRIVPPAQFIPLAEATGRIEAMTWSLLGAALCDMQPVMKADRQFKLSVNVMPRHLLVPGFIKKLRAVVLEARVSPRQVVLELTEREAMPDLATGAEIVARLQALAFKVALDDVGIGHSGLSQLKALGADIIKIDKFFVDTITLDPATAAIVGTLVTMAHQLGMGIVAEGIETEEQKAALSACGVGQGQGYLVSQPIPRDAFLKLLRDKGHSPQQRIALVA